MVLENLSPTPASVEDRLSVLEKHSVALEASISRVYQKLVKMGVFEQ